MPTNVEFLRRVEIFEDVADADLETIVAMLKERRYPEGQVLFKEGDPGDALLIVAEGRIKVSTGEGASERVLAFYEEGEVLGEIALLTGETRSASAVAATETRVLALPKEDFDEYLSNHVVVMREMMRIIARRQVESNIRLARGGEPATEVTTRAGKIYVVFSPRGGSGKTMIAVNLAVQLALLHPDQAALLDLSLTFGHCAVALNLAPKSSLSAISEASLAQLDRESLSYYLVPHVSTLKLMAGANKPEEGEAVESRHVKAALELMKGMYAAVVVDTSSDFKEATLAALEMADKVVLVCTPDLGTLRDVRECQRILNDLIHLPRQKVYYVMNHVFSSSPLSVDQFAQALEQEMNTEIPSGGDLPAKAAIRGEAFVQTNPGAGVSKAIINIARQFDAEAQPQRGQPTRRRGFLGLG